MFEIDQRAGTERASIWTNKVEIDPKVETEKTTKLINQAERDPRAIIRRRAVIDPRAVRDEATKKSHFEIYRTVETTTVTKKRAIRVE
jgi:hypothetical protein